MRENVLYEGKTFFSFAKSANVRHAHVKAHLCRRVRHRDGFPLRPDGPGRSLINRLAHVFLCMRREGAIETLDLRGRGWLLGLLSSRALVRARASYVRGWRWTRILRHPCVGWASAGGRLVRTDRREWRVQAAMAHARTPMQMMAAKQQLMAAKSRQVAERMEFNCFN